MMRLTTLFPLILLAACGGGGKEDDGGTGTDNTTPTGDDDDDDVGDDDDDDDGCSVELAAEFPEDGATNALFRTDVIATLSEEDPGASIEVDGVAGMSMVEGVLVSFTPDAPLAPNTAYTATLTTSCGTESWSFTTSDLGGATNEAELTDGSYSLNLSSGTWILPPGVGKFIGDLVGDVEVLFGVTAVNATSLEMIGALGDGSGNPDICYPTLDIPVDPTWENPYFELEAPQLLIAVEDLEIAIDEFYLGGAFTTDASAIEGGVLRGFIDTRPLVGAFDATTDGAVCDLVTLVGVECENCGDGQPYCLSVWVTDIVAAKVPTVITPRTEPDPSCP